MEIILDTSTKSITAVMTGAKTTTDPYFTSAYLDGSTNLSIYGSNNGSLNGTTSVTVVAKTSYYRRKVTTITIQNIDTVAVTIILKLLLSSGTFSNVWKGTLQVNDTFVMDESGLHVLDTNGKLKVLT